MTSEGHNCARDLSTAHIGASSTNGQALPDRESTQVYGAFATATAALVEWEGGRGGDEMRKWIFVDVEATGRSPINGAMTEFGAVDYKTRQTFHGVIWESHPAEDNPAVSIITGKLLNPLPTVMSDFARWLEGLGKGRPIFISDNPAYDYQWINAAFDICGMANPFGHSARRIGDFWAGLRRDWSDTQSWKRLRVTPHDHNPVNDAMGNVEAFERILQKASSPDDTG